MKKVLGERRGPTNNCFASSRKLPKQETFSSAKCKQRQLTKQTRHTSEKLEVSTQFYVTEVR